MSAGVAGIGCSKIPQIGHNGQDIENIYRTSELSFRSLVMGPFERKISSTLKCISKLVEIGTFKYTPNSTFGDKVAFSINLRKSQSTSCEYSAFFSSNLRHLTHSSYLLLSFPVTDIWVKTHMWGKGQKVVKVFLFVLLQHALCTYQCLFGSSRSFQQ